MSRPLTIGQINAFRAVVLSGTTVAAAQMLHTTQPSISRLLAQAQSATGLKLFINDRGRLRVTREGRMLFETIQLQFQGIEHIEQTVVALRSSGAGVFRIACTPALALGVLPQVLEVFTKAWPNVHSNVQTLGSRAIRDGLRQGIYDIAVTNNLLEGSEFQNHVVHSSEAVCIMSLDHALADRAKIHASDLQHYPLISLERGDALEAEMRKVLANIGLTITPAIETIYSATICAFAAQGLGVSVVNPYMAMVFKDRLSIRRFAPTITVKTYVTFSRFSPPSELADRFLEALNSRMRSDEWSAPLDAVYPTRRRRTRPRVKRMN